MNDYGASDRYPEGNEGPESWFEMARQRVQTPGSLLKWFGIISLSVAVLSLIVVMVDPDTLFKRLYDFQADMIKKNPQNQQKLPPYEEFVKTQTTQSLISNIVSMVASFFIIFGGMKMKQLQGYGMAIAGSILAILPCNCCCCIGAIPGIWALVVLLNSDVKLAFVRGGRAGGSGR